MGDKHKAGLFYTVPGLSVVYLPCQFLFTACQFLFLACPAEMLSTLQLKTGRLPGLMGHYQIRSVMFTTGHVCFQVWLVCVDSLSGGVSLVFNNDSP